MGKARVEMRTATAAKFTDLEGHEHQVATLDIFNGLKTDCDPTSPIVVLVDGMYHPVDPSVIEYAPFGGMMCVILHIDEHGAIEPDYELVEDAPVH